ncbi:MAG: PAS domain S-box protein [Halosimplex sp.]
MTGSDDTSGERDEDDAAPSGGDDSTVRIGHFDPDETVRSRLATAVEGSHDDVAYWGTDDVEAIRRRLADGEVDVLVVEPDASVDVAALVADAEVPVALYTSEDPNEVDAGIVAEVDTFVEKWAAEEGLAFVVEKLLGAARTGTAPGSKFTRAFRRVDPDTRSSSSFLLYADGTVLWETATLESLFDRREATVAIPETPNFYRQLSTALSHDPEAVRTIRGSDVPDDPTEFTVPTADGEARFRYSEHEFPETVGPLRLVVVEDVTRSARSDARFELLKLLDRRVEDGISVVDANGRVEYHNESFADLLGAEDMIGEHSATFMAEGELEAGQRAVQRLRASDRDSEVIDMDFETADGERRTLAVHFSVRDGGDDGGYEGLVNVARDVTDRRERERALEQYRHLVESAGDPMYVVDADDRVRICNDPLADLLGRTRERLDGAHLPDLLPDAAVDRIADALDRARETGESAVCEFELSDEDGEVRQFEATVAGLADAGASRDEPAETGAGSVGIFHEVTERERRESELDLLKQVLTRVLRHDVRTGLTVVRGQAEVLAERTTGEERRMARTIVDRSEELVGTTEKARAIERVIESDEGRVTLDLRSVVNRAVANVSAAHSEAAYDVRITERTPVRAHQALPYAIENLVENAVQHSSATADSQARRDSRRSPSVTVTAERDDESVVLRIADDGPGISQAELEVLENREETPLKHGTGVGLWLVSWVVERSGGELEFDTDGDGTTATVRLDAGDPEDLP